MNSESTRAASPDVCDREYVRSFIAQSSTAKSRIEDIGANFLSQQNWKIKMFYVCEKIFKQNIINASFRFTRKRLR